MLELLASPELDINWKDSRLMDRSAIWIAAEENLPALVSLLVDHGAKVDNPNKGGWTPLMIAANKGHQEVVAILLLSGADPSIITRSVLYFHMCIQTIKNNTFIYIFFNHHFLGEKSQRFCRRKRTSTDCKPA